MAGKGPGEADGTTPHAAQTGFAALRISERLTGARLVGIASAVLANVLLLVIVAMGGVERPRASVREPSLLYMLPPALEQPDDPAPVAPAVEMPSVASPAPILPPRTAEEEEVSTAITLPPSGAPPVPLGLRGLLGKDPCMDPRERLRRPDCPVDRFAGTSDALSKSVEEAQRTEMASFGPQCTQLHGCLPMPTKTLNGLNPVRPNTNISSGVTSGGGLSDTVGRLAPPNWYHVDPGFGD